MKDGPSGRNLEPSPGRRSFSPSIGSQVLVLVLVTVFLHSAGMWRGRMLDDFFILGKCREMPLGALLKEGLTVRREEAGDFWWIEQDTILSYFRPLLLLTYKLPMMLAGRPDSWQHLINLLLQLGTVLMVLRVARHMIHDLHGSFIAALLFAVSSHNLLAVQWISGRKEPLVGIFLLTAFFFHLKSRHFFASLSFLGALLAGEQAVIFLFIAIVWDVFSKDRTPGKARPARRFGRRLPAWLAYAGVLILYLVLRALLFSGTESPASPYFNPPFTPGYIAQTLFKFIHFLFSLMTFAPYIDKALIEVWINHPLLLALAVVLALILLYALLAGTQKRRTVLLLLALAVISYLPFLSMAAIPFYMYTPSLFFALAVGEALAHRPGSLPSGGRLGPKILSICIPAWILLNLGTGIALSWSPIGDFLKLSPDVFYQTIGVLEKVPRERNVLFIDLPVEFPPAVFHFPKLVAEYTGRNPNSLAVVCDRPGGSDPSTSRITPLGPEGFIVHSVGRPYFHTPGGRLIWLFPEGLMTPGRKFVKPWYAVTIRDVAPQRKIFSRGRSFFSRDEGIAALEVSLEGDSAPPVVISYRDNKPYILLDLEKNPNAAASPHEAGTGRPDFLLRALSGKKVIPPRALRLPDRLIPKAGPKMGLGPLLREMSDKVPAFRRAYSGFLFYLDGLNTQLQNEGGGIFRMEASNIGAEFYARAIEAMGGMSRITLKSNRFGVTWDTLMEKARFLAAESLEQEGINLGEADRMMLVNLLALAQISAVVNQVIPPEYEAEWERRHPERPHPPESPPDGIPRPYWDGVRNSIPYMYHAGALPWRDNSSPNPLRAYDADHFFSHAWMVAYSQYRARFLHGVWLKKKSLPKNQGRWAAEIELVRSRFLGYGYEISTLAIKAGFFEATRTEFLPGAIGSFCRFLGFKAFPIIEAFRDIRVGYEGAVYGASLAVSGLPLKPSQGRLHRKIIDDL